MQDDLTGTNQVSMMWARGDERSTEMMQPEAFACVMLVSPKRRRTSSLVASSTYEELDAMLSTHEQININRSLEPYKICFVRLRARHNRMAFLFVW